MPTDLALSLDNSVAAWHPARFWRPALGLEALLSAMASTAAAAEEGLVVCAAVAGLWAAAGWTGVHSGVPASIRACEGFLQQSLANHVRSVQKMSLDECQAYTAVQLNFKATGTIPAVLAYISVHGVKQVVLVHLTWHAC